jgi:hypothetical protein
MLGGFVFRHHFRLRSFLPGRKASNKLNVHLNPTGLGSVGIGVPDGEWITVSRVSREWG